MSALTTETSDKVLESDFFPQLERKDMQLPVEINDLIRHVDPYSVDILMRTYNKHLESPQIIQTESSKIAIVWRGVKGYRLVDMAIHQSAGGIPANPDTTPPTDPASLAHVSEGESIPEFTFNPRIAESFGRRGFVACFEIDVKYLAQGSVAEDGVVCKRDAPVRLIAWRKGEVLPPHAEVWSYQSSVFARPNRALAKRSQDPAFANKENSKNKIP